MPRGAPALEAALARLADGGFDWVTVTSATTVDGLSAARAVVPPTTRIAAVGETTAAALVAAGYAVDLVPAEDNSARG
ncbi:MAG: uroporphyrinogen-III synthase, partial [Actinobacteria bacterium]|nr:uroporphyrinogen-III synthase [Actinomycetota bacterium]